MSKRSDKTAIAIRRETTLAAQAFARLESATKSALENNADKRELRLLSTNDRFQAIIRSGKTLIEISGDDFAVTQTN